MRDEPYGFDVALPGGFANRFGNHIGRHLSATADQYAGFASNQAMLAEEDIALAEVCEYLRPESRATCCTGSLSCIPGRLGMSTS